MKLIILAASLLVILILAGCVNTQNQNTNISDELTVKNLIKNELQSENNAVNNQNPKSEVLSEKDLQQLDLKLAGNITSKQLENNSNFESYDLKFSAVVDGKTAPVVISINVTSYKKSPDFDPARQAELTYQNQKNVWIPYTTIAEENMLGDESILLTRVDKHFLIFRKGNNIVKIDSETPFPASKTKEIANIIVTKI